MSDMRDAVRVGDAAAVAELLQANIDLALSQPEDRGPTPLHWAASHGHAEIAGVLLQGNNNWQVVTQQEDGKTPLHLAVMHGHADIARMMIDGRPPRMKPPMMLGMKDDNQRTALLCACCVSDNASCAAVLLEHGADVDAADKNGVRSLHLAAMQGDTLLVQALLEGSKAADGVTYKPELDAVDGQGRTPLLCAVMEGHLEVVQALVASGCDVQAKDSQGADAMEWATDLEHDDIAAALSSAGESGGGEADET